MLTSYLHQGQQPAFCLNGLSEMHQNCIKSNRKYYFKQNDSYSKRRRHPVSPHIVGYASCYVHLPVHCSEHNRQAINHKQTVPALPNKGRYQLHTSYRQTTVAKPYPALYLEVWDNITAN